VIYDLNFFFFFFFAPRERPINEIRDNTVGKSVKPFSRGRGVAIVVFLRSGLDYSGLFEGEHYAPTSSLDETE